MSDIKPFNATLRMFDHQVNFLGVLYGTPTMVTYSLGSGGSFSGRRQTADHSSLLGLRPQGEGTPVMPLKVHFQPTTKGYVLSIKNHGDHYEHFIGKGWQEVLGAKKPNTHTPLTFTLVDHEKNIITPSDMTARPLLASLITSNNKFLGGLKSSRLPYIYLAETDEKSKITFILSDFQS
jgi:hypothetical protein